MELIETTDGQVVSAAQKPKRPKKKPTKAKKPAKKSAAKKVAKKPAAKKAVKKTPTKKTLRRKPPSPRSERLDMRLSASEKARIVAKAKRLRRTVTSIVYEAIEKIK